MLLAEQPPACGQHLLYRALGAGEVALRPKHRGEVVLARERVGMLLAEQALQRGQHPLMEFSGTR